MHVGLVIATTLGTGALHLVQQDSRRAECATEPVVPIYQLQYWVPCEGKGGHLSLDTRTAVLEVSLCEGPTCKVDLRSAVPHAFKATNLASSRDGVIVVGYDATTDHGLILEVGSLREKEPKTTVLYDGERIRRPIAAAVGWPAKDGIVVLDDCPRALYAFDRRTGAFRVLVDKQGAPSLALATDVRIVQPAGTSGGGFEIRVCSVSDDALSVPKLSRPAFVFLLDPDGDGVVDSIQDAPWSGR